MLCEITIENLAVIEKASAQFSPGFTVLTGETGAGKSILIDSINAILGNRTSRDVVRSGAGKARIWARFASLPKATLRQLDEAGYPVEDELLVYREIAADGKSGCRINGAPATAGVLREICGPLINIHGQHDNQSLLNPARHLEVLDSFAQNEGLLAQYATAYAALRDIEAEIQSLSMNEAEKLRKIDLLQYEVDEIQKAELYPEEEDDLQEQKGIIRNAQNILDGLNNAYLLLSGGDEDPGATTLLGEASNHVSAAAKFASELEDYANTLSEMYYTVGEISSELQNRLSNFEFDARALDDIELRLDLIYKLKHKYGGSVYDVIAYGDKAAAELEKIQFSSERLEALEAQKGAAQKTAQALADKLTESRENAFAQLTKNITGALDFLNMPGIQMALQNQKAALGPDGQDELEFYISTNPGEAPKPLAKIASGGELSRIMLAMKSALADRDAIPTVIYDEIDTGISGLASGRIGKLLQSTAGERQVICVTHTAQVAAYANNHLLIEKQVADGRTFTGIKTLSEDERADELARIMGGDTVTETTRASAREMLQKAHA